MTAPTRTPFQPKGDRPEWQIVYDHLRTLNIGDTITYATLDRLLDRDFTPDRSPIYRARYQLEANDRRTLANVVGVGYRIAHPSDHLDLAQMHHRKMRRQLKFRRGRLSSTQREALTNDERRRLDDLELNQSRLEDVVRQQGRTIVKNQQALESVAGDQAATAAQVEKLTAALKRHGITLD